jgi:DNA-binding NtrC family response regulator
MKDRVLIVDDEAEGREALAELATRWGYDVQTAGDGTEALRRAIEWHPDVILSDLVMPNMDGLWLLRALRAELPDCPVVLLTGRGSIQIAVQAIKEGAWDFIEKPLEVSRLRIVVERALEKKETAREVQLLRRRLAALAPGTDMVGAGPAMQKVFELAHNGTLFLDEIGELPSELQAKFLRVLEERKFRRLGGRAEVEVDVRVLCASNRDLKEEIRRGRFREDLFFRLGVFGIHLPPLKERREDVPLLVHHFIEKFNAETGKRVQGVAPAAMAVLQGYAWPGNIRELRNTVERAMILTDGELLGEEHLPPEMQPGGGEAAALRLPLGQPLDQVEKDYILATLQRSGGNKARTAELLGISEKTLYNKLNRYTAEARSRGGEQAAE